MALAGLQGPFQLKPFNNFMDSNHERCCSYYFKYYWLFLTHQSMKTIIFNLMFAIFTNSNKTGIQNMPLIFHL